MTFFEFASAWCLGFLTNSLGNDNVSIAKCREDLLELEQELRSLRENLSNTHRAANTDINHIKNIEKILKTLNIHNAGLLFQNYDLQKLIEESLQLINNMENNPSESQNQPLNICIDLKLIWGSYPGRIYQATKIKDLQVNFFHKSLACRFLHFIRNNQIKSVVFLIMALAYLYKSNTLSSIITFFKI